MTTETRQELVVDGKPITNVLAYIQQSIHVPKARMNTFGNYKYRSAEDIMDAAKKVANPIGYSVRSSEKIVMVGSRIYVESTAYLEGAYGNWSSVGYAREDETKKGMDASQLTGATASYARKFALGALFSIDDTKDSDDPSTGRRGRNKGANNDATDAPATPASLRTRLGEELRKYGKTEAAKTTPAQAILLDILTANKMKEVKDVAQCEDLKVLDTLLATMQLKVAEATVKPAKK